MEENDRQFGEDLVNRVLIHKKELDEKIQDTSKQLGNESYCSD